MRKKKQVKFPGVGERIRSLRGSASQATMADELNVPLRSYSRYESGERLPPQQVALRIAAKYGTTVDWLIGGEDARERLKKDFALAGRDLKKLRGPKSLEQVSAGTGIPVETLVMLESGEAAPGRETYDKLCKYFDVTSLFISRGYTFGDHKKEVERTSTKGENKYPAHTQKGIKKTGSHSPLVKAICELLVVLPEDDMDDVIDIMISEIFKRGHDKEGKLLGEFLKKRNSDEGEK